MEKVDQPQAPKSWKTHGAAILFALARWARGRSYYLYSEVSTGAADDLMRATDIARDMIVRFGMSKELGQAVYEPEHGTFLAGQAPMWRPKMYGEGTAEAIDHAIKALIEEAFLSARKILETNRSILEKGAKALLEHETLNRKELEKIATDLAKATPANDAAA